MQNVTSFRLAINKAAWSAQVMDAVSNSAVVVPMGAALQFDLAFSDGIFNDENILDLSSYSEIVFEILTTDLATAPISVSVAAADFQSCTADEFNAGTAQQLQVTVGSEENLITTQNGAPGNYMLVVYGVNTDDSLGNDILCSFQIASKATGVGGNPNPALSTATITRGATAIASGAATGTVALNLAYVPTAVILTVQAPDGNGEALFATLAGAPSAASFDFVLNGATDRAGYALHWMAVQ